MNCVCVIGFLREAIDDYHRVLEYERSFNEDNGIETKIAAKYWTNQSKNILMAYPPHTRVEIQGHLDSVEKFGTILVVESIKSIKDKWENSSNT